MLAWPTEPFGNLLMSIWTEIAGSRASAAGESPSPSCFLEQALTIRTRNCLTSRGRAKLAHGSLDVDPHCLLGQAKNGRDFVGRFSRGDPAEALAFSTAQEGLLGCLEELWETLACGFVIDMRKKQKRCDVGFGAPRPKTILRFAHDRNKAEVARRVNRYCEALDQTEVGQIVPSSPLLVRQIRSRPDGRPIKAHTPIEAGMIVGAVRVKEMPGFVPARGEIERSVLVHAPLAGRVLCRTSDIASDKAVDPDLDQRVGQNAYGSVNVFRGEDLFPELMPRLHDRLPTLGTPSTKAHSDASKDSIQHRVGVQCNPFWTLRRRPDGCDRQPHGPAGTAPKNIRRTDRFACRKGGPACER
jgi:hypothetical protein